MGGPDEDPTGPERGLGNVNDLNLAPRYRDLLQPDALSPTYRRDLDQASADSRQTIARGSLVRVEPTRTGRGILTP